MKLETTITYTLNISEQEANELYALTKILCNEEVIKALLNLIKIRGERLTNASVIADAYEELDNFVGFVEEYLQLPDCLYTFLEECHSQF